MFDEQKKEMIMKIKKYKEMKEKYPLKPGEQITAQSIVAPIYLDLYKTHLKMIGELEIKYKKIK